MQPIRTQRTIHAALEEVFRTISDVRNFRQAVPHITKIDFLTDQQVGVGTRFLETRLMQGREQTVELEVAEYVENDRIRMRSDAGGTLWDSLFTVSAGASGVTLEMQMDILPHTLFAKIITPMIKGMVVRGVASDMDAVKTYCETISQSQRTSDFPASSGEHR